MSTWQSRAGFLLFDLKKRDRTKVRGGNDVIDKRSGNRRYASIELLTGSKTKQAAARLLPKTDLSIVSVVVSAALPSMRIDHLIKSVLRKAVSSCWQLNEWVSSSAAAKYGYMTGSAAGSLLVQDERNVRVSRAAVKQIFRTLNLVITRMVPRPSGRKLQWKLLRPPRQSESPQPPVPQFLRCSSAPPEPERYHGVFAPNSPFRRAVVPGSANPAHKKTKKPATSASAESAVDRDLPTAPLTRAERRVTYHLSACLILISRFAHCAAVHCG